MRHAFALIARVLTALSCLAVVSPNCLSEEATSPTIGHGQAHLAARPNDQSPWRLVDQGEPLPGLCELRSAGSGVRVVELGGVKLQIEGGATLRIDTAKRQVVLLAGRVGAAGATGAVGEPWRISAGDVGASVAAESRSVWSVVAGGPVEVHTLAGKLEIQVLDAATRIANAAPASFAFDTTKKGFATRRLDKAEQDLLERTFHDGPAPQGLGQLVVEDSQSGAVQRLEIARYHVNVVLQPPVALVQIDQSFYNPFPQQMEGTFVFNLPAGSAVSRFAMYVTREQLIEGELIERQRANQVYTTIVNTRRDPAILEDIGNNLFRMRVFPIFAQDTKRILLDYTVPLEPAGTQYKFRLPLFSDLKPIWDFSVTGQLQGDANFASFACPTHPELEVRRDKDQATWKWSERDYKPRSDMLLSFRGKDEKAVTLRTQLVEPLPAPGQWDTEPNVARDGRMANIVRDPRSSRDTTYFMLTIPASVAGELPKAASPADVLLLVDTSQLAKDRATYLENARTVLRHLRPEDRLRVAVVDVNHRLLHDGWLRAGTPEVEHVLAQLAQQYPLGMSLPTHTIGEAVQEVFGPGASSAAADDRGATRRRQVVWLGEGLEEPGGIVRKPLDATALAPKLREANVCFTALVASDVIQLVPFARARLESLASATSGRVIDAHHLSGQAELLEWLLAGLSATPYIESLAVDGALDEELLYPKSWAPGRPLRVYGRAERPKQLGLKMTIRRDGRVFEHRQTLDVSSDNALFVGRTWAQQRIARWRDSEETKPAGMDELRRRIIAVSQEWSVLSPHTAFLVLETEQDYVRWKIDRSLRRKYWKPQGTEPTQELSAEWLARIMKDQKAARLESKLASGLARAREDLAKGNFARAYWELSGLDATAEVDQRLELERLRRFAEAGLARETARRQIPRDFPLFDLNGARSSLAPNWSRYVLPDDDVPTDLPGSRFAKQLSKMVSIAEVPAQSLQEMAEWIERTAGVPVDFDRRALDAIGVGLDGGANVTGFGEISIGSYLAFAINTRNLRIVEEPDRLLVTTADEHEKQLTTEVYPLEDLLLSEGVASLKQLRFSPAEARRRAAASRLRAKLQEPVTIELLDSAPLNSAVEHFADKLGVPVVLDVRALEAATIGADQPIGRMRMRGIPAAMALRRMLQGPELTFTVHNEAILVTTREEAKNLADVRVYSGRSLVHSEPVVPQQMYDYSTQPPSIRTGWWPNGIWPRGGSHDEFYLRQGPFFTSIIPVGGGGFGGGMGGMGGGMGGSGGGMGGGMFGGAATAFAGPGGANPTGLSSGGDGGDGAKTPPASTTSGEERATAGVAEASLIPAPAKPPKLAPNPQPLLDVVQNTIGKPEPGWVDDGGIGEIRFFDPTLDFVVRTTDETHDEIAKLFDRLAKLPKSGIPAAHASLTTPKIGREEQNLIGSWQCMELIEAMVGRPEPSWVDDGGVNQLKMDLARLALVVSAVPSSHEELHTLLTLFRRSRYEAKFGSRPWEFDDLLPFGGVAASDQGKAVRQASRYPAEELARLSVRRVPQAGRWRWNRAQQGGKPNPLTLALAEGRLEFTTPLQVVRIAGQEVAEAHTDLGSVVLHRDVEAAVRQLDSALPWWPHRSNEELASLFVVDPIADESTPQQTVLRLIPRTIADQMSVQVRGAPVLDAKQQVAPSGAADGELQTAIESPVAFIKVGFERASGQLVRFEIHFDRKLIGRLGFAAPAAGKSDPSSVTLLDEAGRPIVVWSLVESSAVATPLAAVDAGWDKFVVLDRREAKPKVDAEYHAIVAAMSTLDWRGAFEKLQTLIAKRPEQPLLKMLRGVCALNDDSLAPRAQALADLRQAAASSASGIALALATQPQFEQRLTAAELSEILAGQPESQRQVDVWLRLARLAHGLGDSNAALRHVRRAWALTVENHGGTVESLDKQSQRRLFITLLLVEKQVDEARKMADEFLVRAEASTDHALQLSELFAQQKQPSHALAILQGQLTKKKPDAGDRYRLTRRAADYAEGVAKCQWLFDALHIPGAGEANRAADIELLASSLPFAADAAKLAAQTTDTALRGRLLYAQAMLTPRVAESGALYAKAIELAPIPRGMEEAVTKQLIDAELFVPCVAWFEGELRAGRPIDRALLNVRFAMALKKAGREREAARVMP